MIAAPSPEAVELAIEIVNLFAVGARAGSASCTLESIALGDYLGKNLVAIEIEARWCGEVPDAEVRDWTDVADVATTITGQLRGAAA